MSDGSTKRVRDIKKGDVIKSTNGPAKVICVVKTRCFRGTTSLVTLKDGLQITPYHPIRVENTWQFPCAVSTPQNRLCDAVYSFALDSSHIVNINGVDCVTLGHNFTDDKVVSHPFFGSQRVLEALKSMPGWTNGKIVFDAGCIVKDATTGLATGFSRAHLVDCKA
jgi:hypothetical protein